MTDHEEAVSRLQQMLRFDTTNPPGNELALVAHLAAELKVEGLEAEVLQAAQSAPVLLCAFEEMVRSGPYC